MRDLLPGEGELGNQVLSHPISPLKNDAVVRILRSLSLKNINLYKFDMLVISSIMS
jgi:hypothetical protein